VDQQEQQFAHILTESSPEIDKLGAALAGVQAKMKAASRGEEGQIGQQRYKYADLAAVWSAAQPALGDAEIAVVATNEYLDGRDYMAITLVHSSGQFIRGRVPVFVEVEHRGINNAQAFGSAMTYARRYGTAALVGVVIEGEDDDAQGAGDPGQQRQPRRQQQQQPQGEQEFPSDKTEEAICLQFHKKPTKEQNQALRDNGFVWYPEKFRWEALPTEGALRVGKAILSRQPNLVKWHRGVVAEEGAVGGSNGEEGSEGKDPEEGANAEQGGSGEPELGDSDEDPTPTPSTPNSGESSTEPTSEAPNYEGLTKPVLAGTVKALEKKLGDSKLVDKLRGEKLPSEMKKAELVEYAHKLRDATEGEDGEFEF
jgi:hypothetical protein